MNRPEDKWISPVYDRHGKIVRDEGSRVARDGDTLRFPMALMDHNTIQHGETKMTTSTYLATLDGVTMTKDSAIKQLQDQLAAERSRADRLEGELSATRAFHAPVQDAAPVRDELKERAVAAAHALRDRLIAENRAKYDGSTPQGSRAKQLSDAWR